MSQLNRRSVFDLIRTHSPINRAEIARLTDLSIPTVMKIIDEMEEKQLIRKIGKGESNGGKRPELLEIAVDAYYIIGVGIGRSITKAIVMDLDGNIISQGTIKTGQTIPHEDLIHRWIQLIDNVIRDSKIPFDRFLGMGIGMPGLLDTEEGIVLFSPDFEWENVNLIEPFQKHFKMDICLENSNRALALGEYFFGAGTASNYFILVSIGHGIGSAILKNGDFYRGSSGSSGEFGHITMEKEGPKCKCGNKGCLEALASGNAIAKTAMDAVIKDPDSIILKLSNNDTNSIEAKEVFDAAKLGDKTARKIVDDAIQYIGIGLASYINLMDPDMIILAGAVVNAGDIFIDGLKKVIKERQMKFAGRKVKIQVSKLGVNATSMGAASIILKKFIENGATLVQNK